MGFFNKIFVLENRSGELTDITDLNKKHYESFLDAMHQLIITYEMAIKKKDKVEYIAKCVNCKYYMKVMYKNGKGGKKTFCLKLDDILSANIVVTECNQFEPKNK